MMSFSAFNWVDWFIVIIVVLSTVLSLKRGFFQEALSLVIWLLAIIISFTFHPHMSVLLDGYIASPSLRQITAVITLFIICLMAGGLFSFLMGQLIMVTGLTTLDRLLGLVFGFLRGVVIVVVVLMVARTALPVNQEVWWQGSSLIPHFARIESSIMLIVVNIQELVLPYIKNLF
jgi:membrane protein required for colicin V production